MKRWLDNVNGNDAWNGEAATFQGGIVGPKLTWDAAIQQVTGTGDIMNVIATGTPYDISTTRNIGNAATLAGTNFTSFGCKIQAVDVNENPATAVLRHAVGGVSMIGVRENQNYVIIKGFKIDRTTAAVSATNTFININDAGAGTAGPGLVQYCHDISTATSRGAFVRETAGSGNTASWQIEYCFVQNPSTSNSIQFTASTNHQLIINNVIFELGISSPVLINFGTDDSGSGVDHRAHHNTVVCRSGRIDFLTSNSTLATGANITAQKHLHSNLFVQFTASGGSDAIFTGSATWEDTPWTGQRTIGWNVFVDAGGFSWTAGHPYIAPWDPDSGDTPEGDQYWATDTIVTAGGADPFEASGTPFNWNPNGSGYTIALPGDYRVAFASGLRAAGMGGSVPGAIEDSPELPPSPPDPASPPPVIVGDPGVIGPGSPGFLTERASLRAMFNSGLALAYDEHAPTEHTLIDAVVSYQVIIPASGSLLLPTGPSKEFWFITTDTDVSVQLGTTQVVALRAGQAIFLSRVALSAITVTNSFTDRSAVVLYAGMSEL